MVDSLLAKNLDFIKRNMLESNMDWTICVDGDEGTGKTTMAADISLYFDSTFNEKRMAYSYEDINTIIENIGANSTCKAIVLDEGAETLFNLDFMKRDVRELTKLFFRIRKKRLLFIVCIPDFLDLVKSLKKRRFKTLIHCVWNITSEGLLKQGKYEFFSYAGIKKILENKKYGRPEFTALFSTKGVPADLWERIQQRNFLFLDKITNKNKLKVEARHSFELKILQALETLLGANNIVEVNTRKVIEEVTKVYGEQKLDWLTSSYMTRQLRKFGFLSRRSTDNIAPIFKIEREFVLRHREELKREIELN